MWKEIVTAEDIEELLKGYGNFHDSCLRDLHLSTREWVDEELTMSFDNKNVGTLLFQRQYKINPVLELKFEGIDRLNFNPYGPEYSGLIYGATFTKVEGLFYWSDELNWEVGDNEANW